MIQELPKTLFEAQSGPKKYLTPRSRRLQETLRLTERLPGPSVGRYNVSVSHSHRLVWFRVAKVGSTTIRHALLDAGVTLDLEQHFGINVPWLLTPGYLRAAFVRHPTERFVSGWRQKVLRWNYLQLSDELYEQSQDLAGFLDWFEQQDITTCDPHFRLQSSLIPRHKIHFLGRMETFNEDVDRMFELIGSKRVEDHHRNKANPNPPEISDANKRRIDRLYERDFKRFGYTP